MGTLEKVDQQYKLVEKFNSAKEQGESALEALQTCIEDYSDATVAEQFELVKKMQGITETLKEIEVVKFTLYKLMKEG